MKILISSRYCALIILNIIMKYIQVLFYLWLLSMPWITAGRSIQLKADMDIMAWASKDDNFELSRLIRRALPSEAKGKELPDQGNFLTKLVGKLTEMLPSKKRSFQSVLQAEPEKSDYDILVLPSVSKKNQRAHRNIRRQLNPIQFSPWGYLTQSPRRVPALRYNNQNARQQIPVKYWKPLDKRPPINMDKIVFGNNFKQPLFSPIVHTTMQWAPNHWYTPYEARYPPALFYPENVQPLLCSKKKSSEKVKSVQTNTTPTSTMKTTTKTTTRLATTSKVETTTELASTPKLETTSTHPGRKITKVAKTSTTTQKCNGKRTTAKRTFRTTMASVKKKVILTEQSTRKTQQTPYLTKKVITTDRISSETTKMCTTLPDTTEGSTERTDKLIGEVKLGSSQTKPSCVCCHCKPTQRAPTRPSNLPPAMINPLSPNCSPKAVCSTTVHQAVLEIENHPTTGSHQMLSIPTQVPQSLPTSIPIQVTQSLPAPIPIQVPQSLPASIPSPVHLPVSPQPGFNANSKLINNYQDISCPYCNRHIELKFFPLAG